MPRGGVRAYLWQCHATNLNDGALLDLQVLLHPARDADLSLGRGELEHATEGPLSALRRHLEGHRLVAAAKGRWRKQEGKGGGGGGGGGIRGKGAVARDVHVKHGHLVFELQNLFDGGHWHQYLKCESMSWITGLNLVIREQENWPCASPRRHRSFISKGFTLPPSSTSGAARVSGLTHL